MITVIYENFLLSAQCIYLMDYYESNLQRVKKHRDIYPLLIKKNEIPNLERKLRLEANKINKSDLDYFEIVKFPVNSYLPEHTDFHTIKNHGYSLASIIYLKDDFEGGRLKYKDGLVISPRVGRAVFFDGMYYTHSVETVKIKPRYTIASWYKDKQYNV